MSRNLQVNEKRKNYYIMFMGSVHCADYISEEDAQAITESDGYVINAEENTEFFDGIWVPVDTLAPLVIEEPCEEEEASDEG